MSAVQAGAPSSPSSAPRPTVFRGEAVVMEIGGEAKRRKSEDIPRGFPVPGADSRMAPVNVNRPHSAAPFCKLHGAPSCTGTHVCILFLVHTKIPC